MFRNLTNSFYGWRVVSGAFVLAVFGWGMGFYGPPVWLGVVHATRGWPIALISSAVTLHFLAGAFEYGSPRVPGYWIEGIAETVGRCIFGWIHSSFPVGKR